MNSLASFSFLILITASYISFLLAMIGHAEDKHFRNSKWMLAISLVSGLASGTMAVLYYVGVFAA